MLKKINICEISIIIILIYQRLRSLGPVQQKIKLPSPNVFLKFELLVFKKQAVEIYMYLMYIFQFKITIHLSISMNFKNIKRKRDKIIEKNNFC